MLMDPIFKAILLSEDEVKLAINVTEKELYKYLPDSQSQEDEAQESSVHPTCHGVILKKLLK
jgi:hypothetical protein